MKHLLALMLALGSLAVSCTGGASSETPSVGSPLPAPNLLSPAPRPTVDTINNQCNVGIIRANHVERGELLDTLGPYAPGWLPQGFGLLFGFQGSGRGMEGGTGAIWTDASCRQVQLEFLPHAAHEESPRPPGQWALTDDSNCTYAPLMDVPCFNYHAEDNGGVLNLRTVGLSQSDAMRIVASIPLGD